MSDGKKGRRFPSDPGARGFSNIQLVGKKDFWRIVWIDSADGTHVIAVGQEISYRRDMAMDMISKQIVPWLLLLPLLLLGFFIILSRELAPLRAIASELQSRAPESTSPLDVSKVPSEV